MNKKTAADRANEAQQKGHNAADAEFSRRAVKLGLKEKKDG